MCVCVCYIWFYFAIMLYVFVEWHIPQKKTTPGIDPADVSRCSKPSEECRMSPFCSCSTLHYTELHYNISYISIPGSMYTTDIIVDITLVNDYIFLAAIADSPLAIQNGARIRTDQQPFAFPSPSSSSPPPQPARGEAGTAWDSRISGW